MTTTAQKINEATAPRSWGRDRPGAPARIARMQTPSDRLRGAARTFMQVAIGLVPVPAFHDVIVAVTSDVVDAGERALKQFLEGQDDWKRDGFKVQGSFPEVSRLGALLNDSASASDAACAAAQARIDAAEAEYQTLLRDAHAEAELAREETAALQLELDAVRAELEELKASGDEKAQEEAELADTEPGASGKAAG